MKRSFSSSSLRGFSLAEVLIAIVIITILTIGSIAVYSSQLGKARDTERSNDVSRMKLYIDQIIGQYGAPPSASTNARRMPDECKTDTDLHGCFEFLQLSVAEDLLELVLDPSDGVAIPGTTDTFEYKYGVNENSYSICATLEDQRSSLINSDAAGGTTPAANATDNMYCIRYTPPGATEVTTVAAIDDPESGS